MTCAISDLAVAHAPKNISKFIEVTVGLPTDSRQLKLTVGKPGLAVLTLVLGEQ